MPSRYMHTQLQCWSDRENQTHSFFPPAKYLIPFQTALLCILLQTEVRFPYSWTTRLSQNSSTRCKTQGCALFLTKTAQPPTTQFLLKWQGFFAAWGVFWCMIMLHACRWKWIKNFTPSIPRVWVYFLLGKYLKLSAADTFFYFLVL